MPPAPQAREEEILDHYAAAICFELGLGPSDFHRVRSFVGCNGYILVHDAAHEARRAISEGRVDARQAWPYTREVFNRSVASASHLYTLLHLVETSLRAWIERRMWSVAGPTWYANLASQHLVDQNAADALVAQFGHRVPGSNGPVGLADLEGPVFAGFGSPEAFLDALSLRNLCHFVRIYYRKQYGPLLHRPPTYKVPVEWHQLRTPLYELRDVRNDIAHARRVLRPDEFKGYAEHAEAVLGYLRFNSVATMSRVEVARYEATCGVAFLSSGYQDGRTEITNRIAASTTSPAEG